VAVASTATAQLGREQQPTPTPAAPSCEGAATDRPAAAAATAQLAVTDVNNNIIIIIIINPCKPYLTASAPRLTYWGAGLR
jgi:hypothetical protein